MKAVVIGGGITGLAVTDELTRRGVRVDLLERSAELGTEASSAAAGILAPQSEAEGPGPFLQLLLAAAQMIPEAVSRLEALTGISVGHRVSGLLALAFSDADRQALEKSLEWQTQAGLAPERMDPPAVRRIEPALDGPVRVAVYWPQTAVLDPRQFVRAYARAVEQQGASIHLNTAARKVAVRAGRAAGVETTGGLIEADWVIHCAGPWAGEEIGLPFGMPSIPARGQILQFSTPAPLFRRVVKSPRAYLVQRADGCLIAGTTLEYVGFDKRTTEEGIRKVHSGVKEISTKAGALPVESSWAGLRPDTPDHLPVLGPTPLEGFLAAFGHFRNGILLAPLTGRLIADWILGSRSSLDLAPFGISRFKQT
ncbi:MAG: glycine oxidase ThiO [Candidatus Omnitrophota bacterium]|nr:glycine oxidase ThiO [Candidatus Omnitrophota bacterium]